MNKLMQNAALLIISCNLVACATNQQNISQPELIGRTDPLILSKHGRATTSIEEYINRVGKRVLLVSNNPDIDFQYHYSSSNEQILELDPATITITVSRGLLKNIKDEAQLAALLTISMSKLSNSSDIDKGTIIYLSRAGYDPEALVNIQESQADYLKLIYTSLPDAATINANKIAISKLPQGLKRGVEDFNKQMQNIY
jgi:predicted Zn-dependent protease